MDYKNLTKEQLPKEFQDGIMIIILIFLNIKNK